MKFVDACFSDVLNLQATFYALLASLADVPVAEDGYLVLQVFVLPTEWKYRLEEPRWRAAVCDR